jgi:hypothetical protein
LCVLVVSAYLPALKGGFIWDDRDYISENSLLRDQDGLRKIWTEPASSPQYYPLVFTSFWVEYRIWRLDTLGYHLVNVLLHTLGAALLWGILAELAIPGAWLGAAFFALHPVNVESVAWIAERKNTLSLVFFLGSIAAYLRFALPDGRSAGAPAEATPPRSGRRQYLLALLLFALALLSKTTTAVMPGVVLIALWLKKDKLVARDATPLLPFGALGLAAGLTTAWLEMHHVGAVGAEWEASLPEKIANAGRIVAFYLGKLIWPTGLSFIYPRWEHAAWDWVSFVPLATLGAGAAALWVARSRIGKGHSAAAGYFVLCLAPVLGFLNIYPMRFSFVADHFQYLASIGPLSWAAAMVFALGGISPGRGRVWARRGVTIATLALLWTLTWKQSQLYRDPETLWRATVQRSPTSWLAHNNLADTLLNKGRAPEALEFARAAVALKPGDPAMQVVLGKALFLSGRAVEAVRPLQEALRLRPNHERAKYWLEMTRKVLGAQGTTPPG